jgi:3-deoxy-D-manno-octulosonic-acid transferase
MLNFTSICDEFESRSAALRVPDENELEKNAALALSRPAHFSAMAEAAKKWTESQAGIVGDIVAELEPLLKKAAPC